MRTSRHWSMSETSPWSGSSGCRRSGHWPRSTEEYSATTAACSTRELLIRTNARNSSKSLTSKLTKICSLRRSRHKGPTLSISYPRWTRWAIASGVIKMRAITAWCPRMPTLFLKSMRRGWRIIFKKWSCRKRPTKKCQREPAQCRLPGRTQPKQRSQSSTCWKTSPPLSSKCNKIIISWINCRISK